MKINGITNVQEFFKIVDSCKGHVELLTGEGDRLNLKSKLCQYISMTPFRSRRGHRSETHVYGYPGSRKTKFGNDHFRFQRSF